MLDQDICKILKALEESGRFECEENKDRESDYLACGAWIKNKQEAGEGLFDSQDD